MTRSWAVEDMNKLKDLMLEQEYEERNGFHYADNCILIDKILNQYPDLEKAKALTLSLVKHISLKAATKEAKRILFMELAELIEPQSSGPCFEAYLYLKLINEDLSIAKKEITDLNDRREWENGQGP